MAEGNRYPKPHQNYKFSRINSDKLEPFIQAPPPFRADKRPNAQSISPLKKTKQLLIKVISNKDQWRTRALSKPKGRGISHLPNSDHSHWTSDGNE